MADINDIIRRSHGRSDEPGGAKDARGEDGTAIDPVLMELVELLFFAYRDFTSEPDEILEEYGFGRAHHRVLHFVNRHPGLRVADLLVILKITKQSLGRVLKQLVDEGHIEQKSGETDRRERLLYPTGRGRALAKRLSVSQLERIARSLDGAGENAENTVRDFLYGMISETDRPRVTELLTSVARAAKR